MLVNVREARRILTKLSEILQHEGEIKISRRGTIVGRILPAAKRRVVPSHRRLRESIPKLTASEHLVRLDRDER
ncbi:MAG: prevent-host-death protein [Deltaproteobacteria bacterium]|nr:prevent-host-death protein [Deltaproteobacteria bacterium]